MARIPKDPAEAVELLGVAERATVVAVGPAEGYVEALAEAVGAEGKVLVQHPPPDLAPAPDCVEVLDELPAESTAETVVAWIPVVAVGSLRTLLPHVAEGGALWLVLPKADRDSRAPVTVGEVKRVLLPTGWRVDREVVLATDSSAVRFHRRR